VPVGERRLARVRRFAIRCSDPLVFDSHVFVADFARSGRDIRVKAMCQQEAVDHYPVVTPARVPATGQVVRRLASCARWL
jgi:hypothetical protein